MPEPTGDHGHATSVVDPLAHHADFVRTLLDSAGEGIVIFDGELRYRLWNRCMETLTGFSAADVLGRVAPELFPDLHANGSVALMRRALDGEMVQSAELPYRVADGTIAGWYVVRYEPLRNASSAVVAALGHVQNITARKRVEERLSQSRKIEAVGRLAGGVAHDYNNLLTVICGNAQLLLSEPGLSADVRAELEEVALAADRAAALTRQLLAFSQQQVLQPSVISMNEVVMGMEKLLRRLAGEATEVTIRVGADAALTLADRGQLEQVLLNLVVNARDAMPDGGRLAIATADVRVDDVVSRRHRPMPVGDYVLLTVSDSGIGMDERTQARIFEPFFTTRGQGRGTGLGLSTVYGIVKQSGGYIWVESAPGAGTTFYIYLPRAERDVSEPPHQGERHASSHLHVRILLVDDDMLVRRMTQRTLERAGYSVVCTANAQDALDFAHGEQGRFDLLISDIVMPGMNGRDLAMQLRCERSGLRVLLMSGYTHVRQGLAHDETEFSFLQKPFTAQQLLEQVRALADSVSLAS